MIRVILHTAARITSVSYTHLPLEENIKTVKGVVETAKEYGATVEAALGVVGGNEGEGKRHKILCTNTDDAKRFCDETGVDALAVAIGNAHGNYQMCIRDRYIRRHSGGGAFVGRQIQSQRITRI